VMCAPLVNSEGKPFGVIQLDTQDRTKKFTQDDLKLLVGVGNQASIAMQNARFHAESVARERLKRDLELATQVQLSFLPGGPPQVPGYEFFAAYVPAQEVGGDYYGFVPLPGNKVAFAVGDVAGKGIPAALMMAKLSSDSRLCLLTEPNLSRAVTRLNDMLFPHTSPLDRFVTLAAAMLEPATHKVTLVSAGHQPPLVYKAATKTLVEALGKGDGGLPLGMMEGFQYASCEVVLQPGDCLLIFTDGVTDVVNTKEEAFTEKGAQAAILSGPGFGARAVGERLVKAVKAHCAGRSQFDDITLVCLSRNG
jgi:sigma-B regulation protein RsbU (phosphoserine phosphatase)